MKKSISFLIFIFVIPTIFAASCTYPNQTIISLYSQNNSHAAIFNSTLNDSNAQETICYDQIFGNLYTKRSDPWICDGTNGILRLYYENNSHAANLSQSSYKYEVCFSDLICNVQSTECTAPFTQVLTMSGITNAHLAKDNSYNYRLCCQGGTSTVDLKNANWTNDTTGAMINQINSIQVLINMTIVTSGITDGTAINVSVYNTTNNLRLIDNLTLIVKGNKATFKINLNDNSYGLSTKIGIGSSIYFIANLYEGNILKDSVRSNDLLISDKSITQAIWTDSRDNQIGRTLIQNIVKINATTLGFTSGNKFNITVYKDVRNGPDIKMNSYEGSVVNNRVVIANINISKDFTSVKTGDTFYYIINNSAGITRKSLDLLIEEVNIGCCSGLPQNKCVGQTLLPDQSCKVAQANCSVDIRVDKCVWSNGKCNTESTFLDAQGVREGKCITQYLGSTGCVNGFRTLNIQINTEDPYCLDNSNCINPCQDGRCEIPCWNVALLPVFNMVNLIIAVFIIMILYLIIHKK